jgi:hypothetical protein
MDNSGVTHQTQSEAIVIQLDRIVINKCITKFSAITITIGFAAGIAIGSGK